MRIRSGKGSLMKKRIYWYFIVFTILGGVVCAFLPSIATAKIVFVSYQDSIPSIYVMDDDGSNVQRLTFIEDANSHISTPVWSPNGKRIAFTRSLGLPTLNDLFIMYQDGSDVQQLTNEPDTYYVDVAWGPAGHRLAFSRYRKGGAGSEIYVMDLRTNDIQQLTHHPHHAEQASNPSWSPNGKYIAYQLSFAPWQIDNIYVMDSDGANPHPLALNKDLDQYSPHWSSDSKHILFVERLSEFVQPQIKLVFSRVVIQKQGSDERQILKTPDNWNIHSVCWMDNDKQVLISAATSLVERLPFDIYRYNLSNDNITNLTNNDQATASMPDWVSDSVYVVTPRSKKMLRWGTLKQWETE